MDTCTGCGEILNEAYQGLYDDRYGYPGYFNMKQCKGCGHMVLDAVFTGEQLGDLYSNFYPRSAFHLEDWKPYTYKPGFSSWLSGVRSHAYPFVPPGVRVLDVGCGFGETLGYHRNLGCEVYGVEADTNIRRVADKFGFNVEVGLFDPTRYSKDFFDYVTLNQVMEHVADPIGTLQGIRDILKPGGTAIVTTPNAHTWGIKVFGKRWVHWHTPYHLNIFTTKSMRDYAAKVGLELISSKSITHSDWLLFQWIHLVIRPAMGIPGSFWTAKPVTPTQKWLIRGINLAHRLKFNHWVTRLMDGLDCGDNRVYILRKPLPQ